jgi:hypothetical protein
MEITDRLLELFFGFIILIVGLVLFPTVNGYATTATANATGLAATLLPFVPAFYAIAVIALASVIIYSAAKTSK